MRRRATERHRADDAPGGYRGVKCDFPDNYSVNYYQVGTMSEVETHINQLRAQKNATPTVTDWAGGGLRGKLYVSDYGDGLGTALFTLDGKSVFGTIFTPLPSTGSQPDRKDPATYFEENVKPGT